MPPLVKFQEVVAEFAVASGIQHEVVEAVLVDYVKTVHDTVLGQFTPDDRWRGGAWIVKHLAEKYQVDEGRVQALLASFVHLLWLGVAP